MTVCQIRVRRLERGLVVSTMVLLMTVKIGLEGHVAPFSNQL